MRNYKELINTFSSSIADYVKTNNLKSVVIGLSGGLDSTVCVALCKIAKTMLQKRGTDVKIIGASLPTNTNLQSEENTARECGKFCDMFIEAEIQSMYNCVLGGCEAYQGAESTPISRGNIKARLRMIFLYNLASLHRGIVIDTDNLTECFLGFWTIHGDEGDFNPIGSLWKTEVYELAKELIHYFDSSYYYEDKEIYVKCLQSSIDATPTDGNGVMDGGDLAQIAPGHTYNDVDDILISYLVDERTKDLLYDKYGEDTVNKVIQRHKSSSFKRKHRPFVIALNGDVISKDEASNSAI